MIRIFRFTCLFILLLQAFLSANESLRFADAPCNRLDVSTDLELRNDVYANNIRVFLEQSFTEHFSLFGAFSFLTLAREKQMDVYGNVIHSGTDLEILKTNYLDFGIKYFPVEFVGLLFSWKIPLENEINNLQYHALKTELFFEWKLFKNLQLMLIPNYEVFVPSENYKLGNELGIQWQALWNLSSWSVEYIGEFKQRVEESKNKNLKKKYQKQNDRFASIRFKFLLWKNVIKTLDVGLGYEISNGRLYAKEQGHAVEIKARYLW